MFPITFLEKMNFSPDIENTIVFLSGILQIIKLLVC